MDVLTSVCGKTGSGADKCLGIMHSEANQGGMEDVGHTRFLWEHWEMSREITAADALLM